ncbi:MAG TPA: Asp-tRNA(Asn)/Glu-tRNA(Gln) amidotransferase subunit GatA [Candidatus Dormibacteraeota bacterium]|nr:Asp-tRNA(Asn)/Glu-tRNA(Gln) amidotransferase subunit GatA [Candidatus Dormibacteraeota bacterium]
MIDIKRPIADIAADVQAGKIKAVDLVQHCLEAIKANENFHAVLEINPTALEWAKWVDGQVASGKQVGLLAGVPFIAKDNFLTFHTHTTAGSNILKPFKAPYQATAVKKLSAEGAIMVAKANLDAFAHGSSTENSDFGPTKNPVNQQKVPGGSSGGSASAVALGLCSFALGTDTGGSIRQPAAFCGVVGLKPTYGLVSRYGVVAMGSSVDVIGPLARTTEDAALVLDVIAGRDALDATTIEREETYTGKPSGVKGLKIGLIKEYIAKGTDPDVKKQTLKAIDALKATGAEVSEISLPSVELALACYYILVPAEVSSNLARYDGIRYGHSSPNANTLAETYQLSRDEGFGTEAKRRILIGTYVLSSGYYEAYYKQAQKVRTVVIREFEEAFKKFDVLISPTAPTTAFGLGEKADPLSMYQSDVNTVAVNLVGVPAISIPLPSNELPIGLQIVASQKKDATLLSAASSIEKLLQGEK